MEIEPPKNILLNKNTVRTGAVFLVGQMAQDFARQFYNSKAWKDTRKAYAKSKRHLCERCMKEGRITPAEIVHHKDPLTPENIEDLSISLSWNNLEALCRDCHAKAHEDMYMERTGRRWKLDENGKVFIP